jgi:hypothetical protein
LFSLYINDSLDEEIITNLSNLIIESANLNKKNPITLFSTYNPSKDSLVPKVKIGDVMIHIPDTKNTQMYSDDKSSKADKLSRKMHSFVTRKGNKHKEKIYLGVTAKTKHSREFQ